MMDNRYSPEHQQINARSPEGRYAYYRRCQVFRKGGEQCKAPAERGSHICHAHAGQLATAVRRDKERRALLAEAVAQMRLRGRPDCKMADLFMDFNGIQTTAAVMTRALITGRVDCKTAGRLVVELQTFSKLLRLSYRKGRKGRRENEILRQICAEKCRLDTVGADLKSRTTAEDPNLTTEAGKQGERPKPTPRTNTDDIDLRKSAIAESNATTRIFVAPRENRACRRYRRKPGPCYISKWTARVCKNRRRQAETPCTLKIPRHAAIARAVPAALYRS